VPVFTYANLKEEFLKVSLTFYKGIERESNITFAKYLLQIKPEARAIKKPSSKVKTALQL